VIGGIVEIAEPERYLKTDRGFLVIESTATDRSILGKIDYDQFDALVCSSPGFIISGPLLNELSVRNKSLIICGKNYAPTGIFLPFGETLESVRRINHQIKASTPLKKQMWKRLVKEKLKNQSLLLHETGNEEKSQKILAISNKVLSGDSDNKEAYAARIYWPALFGKDYLRSDEKNALNSFLNYGYAIIRSAICRSIVSFGMLPMFGVHHKNLRNYFALADDILEPFRPYVDHLVFQLSHQEARELRPEHKRLLAALLIKDVEMKEQIMPLSNAIYWTVHSVLQSFEKKRELICLPKRSIEIEKFKD